jgi:cardiolipin synthase A/B
MVWILGLYIINSLFMLIVAIREVRRPAKALIGLVICLVFPLIGFLFYLCMTNPIPLRQKRLTSTQNDSEALPDSFRYSSLLIARSLRHLAVNGLRTGKVQILTNGIETYQTLMDSIKKAQKSIDLEYYIYRDDQVGRCMTDLLIERASAGVRVRFVRDGWGSRKFPKSQISRMMQAGIECRSSFPLRFPWVMSYWSYRNHCKIVVIDGEEAFTGGINVGDEYTGLKPNVGFWRDTHIRITGKPANDLQAVFDAHWNIAAPETTWAGRNIQPEDTGTPVLVRNQRLKPENRPGNTPSPSWLTEWSDEPIALNETNVDTLSGTKSVQNAYIQTFEGNPGVPTPIIREVYFTCLSHAIQSIDITNPYFVPDADIVMAIKAAVARSVRVRLLVPRHVVPIIVGAASRTYFGELLEAGVHIYLYNKGVLHAKLMIIDGEIAEVGSSNFDLRSYRLNYEVCEVVYSSEIARELAEQFERDLADSIPLRMEDLLRRTQLQRILDQTARLLAPMI